MNNQEPTDERNAVQSNELFEMLDVGFEIGMLSLGQEMWMFIIKH